MQFHLRTRNVHRAFSSFSCWCVFMQNLTFLKKMRRAMFDFMEKTHSLKNPRCNKNAWCHGFILSWISPIRSSDRASFPSFSHTWPLTQRISFSSWYFGGVTLLCTTISSYERSSKQRVVQKLNFLFPCSTAFLVPLHRLFRLTVSTTASKRMSHAAITCFQNFRFPQRTQSSYLTPFPSLIGGGEWKEGPRG